MLSTYGRKITLTLGVVLVALVICVLLTRNPESNEVQSLTFLLVALGFLLIYASNYIINKLLDRSLPWAKHKIGRFFIQVILGLLASLAIVNSLYIFLKDLYTDSPPDALQLILVNTYGAAIIIPTIAIYLGVKFLKAWTSSQLETERLLKENARGQMMSLRNHLDPHFLFNNLNILSSLIDHDVALSKTYLEKFAEVYRTILKAELSDLITLRKEMELIDAYVYLIKIRWRDALDIKINIPDVDLNKAIPPLSGQMLIENVIKHNVISTSSPMKIEISSADGFLTISNSHKPKQYQDGHKSGTGLLNIQNRYAYFTDRKIRIDNHPEVFLVALPLLEIEE